MRWQNLEWHLNELANFGFPASEQHKNLDIFQRGFCGAPEQLKLGTGR